MGSLGMIASLDKKTKIGISVSIAVVVVLVVMGCAIGMLDCRKGYFRRKERRQNRIAELAMLESEMRSGQQGQKRAKESGLWDNLRSGSVVESGVICEGDVRGDANGNGSLSIEKGSSVQVESLGERQARMIV
ncbi:hypothetical protein P280DRAFT_518453 [Massarina eburnea CBS 473.64]|uniref:Uncharacterized protein n=1 Tax=Massarina eburnea CBS 473.64 TaxID=1395130 RepID=A0A6A6RYG0_9PLEO|nr:hypothetical protein P280DRAFT_518453 [Massarina eburnea CBS 473.64]